MVKQKPICMRQTGALRQVNHFELMLDAGNGFIWPRCLLLLSM